MNEKVSLGCTCNYTTTKPNHTNFLVSKYILYFLVGERMVNVVKPQNKIINSVIYKFAFLCL